MPGSPEGPPPPNTISHKPGFTSTLFEESVSWPRNFPVVSNALMVPSPKFPTRIAFGNAPKVAGVCHHAPRRVEFAAGSDEGAHEIAVHIEDIHLPQAGAGLGIVLGSILHGIGDVDLVTDDVDAVGSETRGKFWIGERTAQRSEVKVAIEDVDFAAIEVRRQKEGAVEQGETFVNRAAGGVIEGHRRCVAGAGPVGDEAIFSVKNELLRRRSSCRCRWPRFP